jgi:hypothetical protein
LLKDYIYTFIETIPHTNAFSLPFASSLRIGACLCFVHKVKKTSDHTQDATITLNFDLDCSDTSRWPTSANSFVVVAAAAAADFLALDVTAAVAAAFVGTVVRGTVVRARRNGR